MFEADDGSTFGKCNRCGHYERDGSKVETNPKKVWEPDELAARLAQINEFQILGLDSRQIPQWVCEHYGVRVGLSVYHRNEVVEHYYPYRNADGSICRYNIRNLEPKAFYSIGPASEAPFGYDTLSVKDCSTRKLFIFEDELSAMSGYFVLRHFSSEKFKHLHPACIGLIAGAGSIGKTLAFLEKQGDLQRFGEIIYVHDNDQAGFDSYKVGRSAYPALRELTTILKDANDMVMAGRWKELFRTLITDAKTRSPDGAATVFDALDEALRPPTLGLSTPWGQLTELLFGMRWGELWTLAGGVGSGKTLVAHAIAAHIVREHKCKTALFMLEERIAHTLRQQATQITGIPFHRPDIPFQGEQLKHVVETQLSDNVFLWKNNGENNWDNIAQCIRFYAIVEGVKFVVVDNITAMTSMLAPTEQNTEISRIATEAAGMADELDITILLLSHLNAPQSGPSHEEGGEVRAAQMTGSRALMRWSHVILGFERNQQADGDYKNYSKIRVLKERMYGRTGLINTIYSHDTGRLVEHDLEAMSGAMDEDSQRF